MCKVNKCSCDLWKGLCTLYNVSINRDDCTSHFGFIVLEIHSHCGGPRSIFVRDCSVFHGQWSCGRGELDGHVVIGAFLQHFVRSVRVSELYQD